MLILGWGFPSAMASVHEISDQIAEFLAGRLSLDQLEDWSAEYSWNIHKRTDKGTQALAYLVRSILNAYFDEVGEKELREELAIAIRPFQPELIQRQEESSTTSAAFRFVETHCIDKPLDVQTAMAGSVQYPRKPFGLASTSEFHLPRASFQAV